MKRIAATLGTVALAIAAAYGGYWYGTQGGAGHGAAPDGATTAVVPALGGTAPAVERKILYYRNPMGLPDTSAVPKKDQMGMDYIPVYAGGDVEEAGAPGEVRISTEKVQKLGVRTEAATRRVLERTVSAAGRVEPDERRVYAIAPKFEGYVEKLHVNVTGQPVAKGQPLFEVYSPELVSAQREYAIAASGVQSMANAGDDVVDSMKRLAQASLARLKNWDVSDEQVRALERSGEAKRTVTFRSPVAGIVTTKKALQGMRFMPGEMLYEVSDLSSVWVIADVFEQDISLVRAGAKANVRINAYPDKVFRGTITYVYPTLTAQTRTIPVRIELPNPGQLLKPSMFAQIELAAGGGAKVVVVPDTAVIDSGLRSIVLVELGAGRFEPREVRTGARTGDHIEIIEGVKEGERVVIAANFLIDAESNLKAAIGSLGAAPQPAGPGAAPGSTASTTIAPGATAASVGHRAEGKVESVDPKDGSVSLAHGPVATLKWPAMTMEFQVANDSLLKSLKPGASVAVEFVERKPGEWVITSVKPAARGN